MAATICSLALDLCVAELFVSRATWAGTAARTRTNERITKAAAKRSTYPAASLLRNFMCRRSEENLESASLPQRRKTRCSTSVLATWSQIQGLIAQRTYSSSVDGNGSVESCQTRVGRSAATDACERYLCQFRFHLQLGLSLAALKTHMSHSCAEKYSTLGSSSNMCWVPLPW